MLMYVRKRTVYFGSSCMNDASMVDERDEASLSSVHFSSFRCSI